MPARNILVINCGSSSIKFALVNEDHEAFTLSGIAERLGSAQAQVLWQQDGNKERLMLPHADHRAALAQVLALIQTAAGDQLHGIGHRVVHGGEHFTAACTLDRLEHRRDPRDRNLGPAAQPSQPTRYRGRHQAVPEPTAGGRVRYRIPPVTARTRLSLRPPRAAVP